MKTEETWAVITLRKNEVRANLARLPWREKLHRLDAMKTRQEALREKRRRSLARSNEAIAS